MAITGSRSRLAVHTPSLTVVTTVATALAACAGQVGLAIPAVLNGLFQQDLGTTSSQLTWISDAFLVRYAAGADVGRRPRRPVRPQAAADRGQRAARRR
jgi:hypothetical protein